MATSSSMVKSLRLNVGSGIAFIAPASGFAALVKHRLEQAEKYFTDKGYKVRLYPTSTQNAHPISSNTAELRAKDVMDAFRDPDIGAIICTVGGNTCHQLIEYLDFEVIRRHPKIFVGYSDITSLHLSLYKKANLCTFYGPSAICQFGEFPSLYEYTEQYFFRAVAQDCPIGRVLPSEHWTDDAWTLLRPCDKSVNWLTQMDRTQSRQFKPNHGFEWLRPGKATGPILGGCIPVLLNLPGEYYPDFSGTILLLETPEGDQFDRGFSLDEADRVLGVLRLNGTFEKVRGLVFGRAFLYSTEQVKILHQVLLENTRGFDFPILYGVDVGHSDPMITVPLGVEATLDSDANLFSIDEAGVYSGS